VQHARRLIEQKMTRKELNAAAAEIARRAASVELPQDLEDQIQALLATQPAIAWDEALAQIVTDL